MSLEDEIAAIKRLVERGEARAGHLESHHGKASIVIDKHDLDAMRAIKARLEGMDAPPSGKLYRHYRRGTVYTPIGDVRVQCPAEHPLRDDEIVLLYRDVNSGHYGARRYSQFYDGRFEEIKDAPVAEGMAAPGDTTEREADWFAFFCRKYVQRSDARQKESGLQYTEAETHDLAKECARHEAEFVTAAPGDATERARDDDACTKRIGDLYMDGTIPEWAAEQLDELHRAALTATEDGARRATLADVETEITRLWFERSTDGEGPELDDVLENVRALATEATPGEGGTTDE